MTFFAGTLRRSLFSLIAAFAVGCTGAIGPAISASDVLDKIKERAQARRDIIALITSGDDAGLRLAAFEEAVKSEDSELRLSAMEAALGSKDTRLRKAALRFYLNGRPEVRAEFILPENANKAQKLLFEEHQGLRFENISVDPQTDIIAFGKRKNEFWSGQLVEDGFDLTFARPRPYSETLNCIMKVRIATATELTGQLDCIIKDEGRLRQTGINRGVIPVRIKIG